MIFLCPVCLSPVIVLIPTVSPLPLPAEFQPYEEIFISSTIRLNCNGSLARLAQWTIRNCSSICSSPMQIDASVVQTNTSELFIPARTLSYGLYQLTLTVSMVLGPQLVSSISTYVKIVQSTIIVRPVPLGTTLVTRGERQNLILDPGSYSVDPDSDSFDASVSHEQSIISVTMSAFCAQAWSYAYYCRIYGLYNYPSIAGSPLALDDSRIDPLNPSCLSNRSGTMEIRDD